MYKIKQQTVSLQQTPILTPNKILFLKISLFTPKVHFLAHDPPLIYRVPLHAAQLLHGLDAVCGDRYGRKQNKITMSFEN